MDSTEQTPDLSIILPALNEAASLDQLLPTLREAFPEAEVVVVNDGSQDAYLVAAAADHVPKPLVEQLAKGGRLVMPVGRYLQDLLLVEKRPDGSVVEKRIVPVAFVPMTGEAEE